VLSASGLDASRFVFAGFVPSRAKDRNRWLEWVQKAADVPVVFFEAPHRIENTLREIGLFLVNRPILVARELTKMHESWLSGTASDILEQLGPPQGEFVGVIGPASEDVSTRTPPTDQEIAELFGQITEFSHSSRREAVKEAARRLGLSPKTVYSALERHKLSGD
jgi:16S rRNA (cytidine1402-2'-O)-methyltransferase